MKKNSLLFAFLLAALFFGTGVSTKAFAQRSFFGKESNASNNDDALRGSLMRGGSNSGEFTLSGVTNNENPTDAPLGSGIVMLVAAGAGYGQAVRVVYNIEYQNLNN